MSIPLPFPNGVTSLLKCTWTLELKTPMVIRASTNASIRNKKGEKETQKGRLKQPALLWADMKSDEWSEEPDRDHCSSVRDFNYEFYIQKIGATEKLRARYTIPGSSIRGALRQSLIHSLVAEGQELLFSLPKQKEMKAGEKENRMSQARGAVEDEDNYWHTILSLFGIAYDLNPGIDRPLIWHGRLEIGSVALPKQRCEPEDFYYSQNKRINSINECAPRNIKTDLKTRSPLDRLTMAAKDKGLHTGIEMSEGQHFTLEFRILNPKPNDIRIISLWKRDINNGFIRFGGLTSQGRGKVSITDTHYALFAAQQTALAKEIRALKKEEIAEEFKGIWNGAALDLETLRKPEITAALQH